MLYFWWGCRRNLKLITLGGERVNELFDCTVLNILGRHFRCQQQYRKGEAVRDICFQQKCRNQGTWNFCPHCVIVDYVIRASVLVLVTAESQSKSMIDRLCCTVKPYVSPVQMSSKNAPTRSPSCCMWRACSTLCRRSLRLAPSRNRPTVAWPSSTTASTPAPPRTRSREASTASRWRGRTRAAIRPRWSMSRRAAPSRPNRFASSRRPGPTWRNRPCSTLQPPAWCVSRVQCEWNWPSPKGVGDWVGIRAAKALGSVRRERTSKNAASL